MKKKRSIFVGICLLISLSFWAQPALADEAQKTDQGGQVRSEGRIGFAEKGLEKPAVKPKPKPRSRLPQTGEMSSNNELLIGWMISGAAILLFLASRRARGEGES